MKKILFVLLALCYCVNAWAIDTLTVGEPDVKLITNKYFTFLEDTEGTLKIQDIIRNRNFLVTESSLPSIHYSNSAIWLRFIIKNKTTEPFVPITINSSIIDEFDLYFVGTNSRRIIHLSSDYPRTSLHQPRSNITHINCTVLPDSSRVIYLRIKSNVNSVIPVQVYSANKFLQTITGQNILLGAFIGIMAVMAAYNLLLWFIVKDISYFYYVCYIVLFTFSQMLLRGFGTSFISADKQLVNTVIQPLSRIFFGYSMILFAYEFLRVKAYGRKFTRWFIVLFALYTVALIAVIAGFTHTAYMIITISIFAVSLSLLTIAPILYYKGYKPAKYFVLAWTLFLVSIILSIARNQGVVGYNSFSLNIILYASAVEVVLFSAALADRINFYRRQNAEAQSAALAIALENERLITEQNIMLESRVNERTRELIESNKTLQVSIENLKAAQTQLVETEKMASLGQLTAGIAHEINNPINFVSANVKPLRMDFVEVFSLIEKYISLENEPANPELLRQIEQYRNQIDVDYIKQEILTLLEGIEEGALRTKEIVDSLRTFSRTDEQSLKPADINKAILSTLVILRSTIPAYISIQPVLNKLPLINCYPGKISQVLINLITNSIHAIKSKAGHQHEHIMITTTDEEKYVCIEISDTGIGITPETKQRMFEPFYTTKDVGEGTGLGLSIVFGIIEKHKGRIDVESQPGQGTAITIQLPKNLV